MLFRSLPQSRRRRFLLLAAVTTLLLLLGLFVVQALLLDEERLRAILVSAARERAGLELQVDQVQVRLLPRPNLSTGPLSLRVGESSAVADSITARLDWLPLLRGEARVRDVLVRRPQLRVASPQEFLALSRHWAALRGARPEEKPGAFQLARIALSAVEVRVGQQVWVVGDAEITDLQGELPRLGLQARVPVLDESAALNAFLAFPGARNSRNISGTLELNVPTLRTTGLSNLSAQLVFKESPLKEPSFQVQGEAVLGDAGPLSFGSAGWLREGALILNDMALQGQGLTVHGDATRAKGKSAVRLTQGSISGKALDLVLQRLPLPQVEVGAAADASITLANILVGQEAGLPRFVSGQLRLAGLTLQHAKLDRPVQNIGAEMEVVENVWQVTALRAPGILLRGSVSVDLPQTAIVVRGQGQADLSALHEAWALPQIEKLGGRLSAQDIALVIPWKRPSEFHHSWNALVEELTVSATLRSQPVKLQGVNGALQFKDGVLSIQKLQGEGLSLEGTLRREGTRTQADLKGELNLASGLLVALLPADRVKDLQGTLTVETLRGTFGAGEGVPEDFVCSGTLKGGAAAVFVRQQWDSLSGVTADFKSDGATISGTASGSSSLFGGLQFEGSLHPGERSLQGRLDATLSLVLRQILGEGKGAQYFYAMAEELGSRRYIGRAAWPTVQQPALTAHIEQEGGGVVIDLAALRKTERWEVTSLRATGVLPASGLNRELPPLVRAAGMAAISATREAGAPAFAVDIDLTQAQVTMAPYLEKDLGIPFNVELHGAAGERWSLGRVEATLLDQQLSFTPKAGALIGSDIDMALQPLSPLLADGRTASGRITGSLSTQPLRAALNLEEVSLVLAENLAVEGMNGAVVYEESGWKLQNLRMAGTRNDFQLDAQLGNAGWDGTLKGARFDLDAALRVLEHFQQPGVAAQTGPSGSLAVALDEVHFRRATLQHVQAQVKRTAEGLSVEGLQWRSGAGTVNGSLVRAMGGKALDLQLQFQNAQLSLLDEALFSAPRGMAGIFSGSLSAQFEPGLEKRIFNTLNGGMQFNAAEGTYGNAGWATRLLQILKTADVLRLRLPDAESGLSFMESQVDLAFTNGVVDVKHFALKDLSYSMASQGSIDFPREQTNVASDVYLLESVTGAVGNIPLIRGTVGLLKDVSSVRITATGSPYAPEFSLNPLSLPGRVLEGIGERLDPRSN